MKVIIVGGVAGGASCAARLRRLDEDAQILMVERGPYVSYANCGLPYHVGGVIRGGIEPAGGDREHVPLAVRHRRADELRGGRHLARQEDRRAARRRHRRGNDRALRQAGAVARGADRSGRRCRASTCRASSRSAPCPTRGRSAQWIERGSAFLAGMHRYSGFQTVRPKTRAVVIGGGFIGLETAENLIHRGFEVTLVEMGDQILGADRPRDGAHRRRLPRAPRPSPGAERRRGRLRAGRRRLAEGAHAVRQGVSGRHRDPRLGVRPDTALARRPGWKSASGAASGSTSTCAPATRTFSPSATPSRSRTS